MELSKQQKVIDRKFAYNTGKLPGFVDGYQAVLDASNKRSQLLDWNHPIIKDKSVQVEDKSPYEIMKKNLGEKSFIGSNFDTKIQQDSGYISDDPYIKNPNLEAPSKISKKLDVFLCSLTLNNE